MSTIAPTFDFTITNNNINRNDISSSHIFISHIATTFNAWLDKYIKNRDPLEKLTGLKLEFDNLSSIINKSSELMQNATMRKTLLPGAIMVSEFPDFTISTNPVIDLNATLLLQCCGQFSQSSLDLILHV
ncbi:unnamed protein product [Didymodactylos carnosus]|uniref:Uncharacterized protein n=1 Tax=Didymodactylos carnosus TaxID=1234261 RepID=A0A814NMT8_9BILA|nr:unnamed protein product [Didymodactylos carnosus]CAF3858864.1 unnamed protein product [Didymodactylos carnosus]